MTMNGTQFKLLLVEDDPVVARFLLALVSESGAGFELIHIRRLADALQCLEHTIVDLILLDLGLEDSWGIETLIKVHAHAPATPIVVLTGDHDEELGVKALQEGAQDYLVKGQVDGRTLIRSIRYAIERKRTMEALQQNYNLLRAVSEVSRDAFYVKDRQGRYLMINSVGAGFLGRPVEDIIGKDDTEVFSPDTARRILERDRRIMECGEPETYESVSTAAGVTRRFRATKGPYYDQQGNVIGLVGMSHDITEHKQAEQALRESEESFRMMATHVPVGIFRTDARGDYLFVNDRWLAITGLTQAEAQGDGWASALHPDDRDRVVAEWYAAAQAGHEFAMEYCLQRPDGQIAWVSGSAVAIRDADGAIEGYFGTTTDVTARKQAGDALRETENRYRTLVEHLPAITYVAALDDASSTLYTSPQIESILGFSQAEWMADHTLWFQQIHADDRARVLADVERSRGVGTPVPSEYRMLTRDGQVKWFHDTRALVRDETGRPLFLQGVMFDITERKQAEEALRESEERFRRFAESTSEGIGIHENGILLDANPTFARMWGYEPAELIGREVMTLIAPESRDFVMQKIRAGYEQLYETVGCKKDQTTFPIEVLGRAIPYHGRTVRAALIYDISERRQAEAALQQSEELYRLITENTVDLISVLDQQMRTVYASPSYWQVLGYDPAEMIGTSAVDLIHPDDMALAMEKMGMLATQGTAQATVRYRHADESWRWIEAHATQVLQDGTHYIVAAGHDVTERELAAEALRESEARYRMVVKNLPLSVYEIDHDGRLLSINQAGLRMIGAEDAAQVHGSAYLDVLPIADDAQFAALMARAYAGESLEIDHSGMVNGQQRVFTSTLFPLVDADGAVRKLTGMTQDITERFQMRLEAEMERDRLDAVLESSNDAVIMIDLDRHVVLLNRAFSHFFGIDAEEALGMPGEQVLAKSWEHFEQPEQFLKTVESLLADPQREASGEVTVLLPTRRALVWYSGSARTRAETHLGRLFIFRDATREKEADLLKTEFISIVSHELRTPLTSIKGFTDLILDGDAGEVNAEVREFLEIVKVSADQLVTITDDILETSRIESGKIKLKPQAVIVSEVLQSVAAAIQGIIGAKEQTLVIDLPPDLPQVYADPERLVQIFTNLLSNAHKYTPAQGGITVRARLTYDPSDAHLVQAEGADGWVVISIADTGIGIAPDDQQHLFSRFYRVSSADTQGIGGTGLGLNITQSLVELHGGTIWVESERGRGSTFSFCLPLFRRSQKLAAEEPAVAAGERPLILVVEPDLASARLIQRHLDQAGYAVRVVAEAAEVPAIVREADPALVILAVQLPDMDGFTLIEQMRSDERTADIPVVAISDIEDMERALRLGVAGCLPRPIDERRLVDIVQATLAQNSRSIALVVDDDPRVARALVGLLGRRGFNAFAASDGHQGLTLATRLQPSLVLLDLWMPGLNGFQVLNVLKQHPATHAIPVIALNDSEVASSAIIRVLSLGAIDIITKPPDLEALEAAVSARLDALDALAQPTNMGNNEGG